MTGNVALLSIPALIGVWIVLGGWPSTPSAARRSRHLIALSAGVLLAEIIIWLWIIRWLGG